MDSQRQGNTSFNDLLNQDYYESMESPYPNVEMDEPQLELDTSVKKSRGGNFSIEEDVLLVEAWINTSIDPVNGNEQSKKKYWLRIWENYHANKCFNTSRNQTSLLNRWGVIQKSVNKFCACLVQVESAQQSGITQQDMIAGAKELYRELVKNPFPFEHCWNILKTCPKWSTNKEKPRKRSFENASSASTQAPINLGEDNISTSNFVDLERPEGRKAAKERLNKQRSKDNADEIVVGLLTKMNERAMIATEKKMQLMEKTSAQEDSRIRVEEQKIRVEEDKIRIEERKVRVEEDKIRVEEDKIMLIDTIGLSGSQIEYIRARQREILERRSQN